ncbi:MAG: sigma-54 factor interaction domain-containing protein [Methylococcaceae bacterium]|nr:sigma-54 factor interaction domain-containing protein [Methylococcaceae bacterium]
MNGADEGLVDRFNRIGGKKSISCNVRIIAATRRDLE